MKRYLILFIALLLLINIGYAQSFSTATDNTCFIAITTPQNTSMNARKELCRVHQFSDRVDLITVDNNLVICTWTKAQAISYGYTLESLEQYLLSILNASCGASTSPPPSPNAGDSLLLSELVKINSRIDTTQTDTSLVPVIDYSDLFYALINKGYDTSQVDTALDKHILLDSTSVRIINDTLNVRFIDSTYYTTLDSIKYYLSIDDSIEICFDTITFQTYVTNLPTTICNGDSAVRVQLCNTDSTLNAIVRTKIDTTNAILYRIESKASSDTTHETILQRIEENTKSDCIGSNETYYINGTNTITLLASEVCSYAITVIEDVVSFTENGVTSPFNLPVGYSGSTSFKNGSKYLVNQVSFTGANATSKAIIKIIK